MATKRTTKEQKTKVFQTYEDLAARIVEKGYRHNAYYLARKAVVDWDLMMQAGIHGKRVLNVGCFEPIDEILWAHAVKEWVAIDLSPKSIEVAKRLVRANVVPAAARKVKFHVMDAGKLTFPDASFDLAVSFSVLDHIPDESVRSGAVREMARVVKPGGHVVITVPNWWGYFHIMHLRNERRGIATDVGFQYFYTRRELKKSMESAGLKVVRFTSDLKNVNDLPKWIRAFLYPFLFFGDRMGILAEKL